MSLNCVSLLLGIYSANSQTGEHAPFGSCGGLKNFSDHPYNFKDSHNLT